MGMLGCSYNRYSALFSASVKHLPCGPIYMNYIIKEISHHFHQVGKSYISSASRVVEHAFARAEEQAGVIQMCYGRPGCH